MACDQCEMTFPHEHSDKSATHEHMKGRIEKAGPGDEHARHLIRWYNHGADGKIRWGEPGDFDRCVRVATEHGVPHGLADPKGFCAERHHDALGVWPGQEDK